MAALSRLIVRQAGGHPHARLTVDARCCKRAGSSQTRTDLDAACGTSFLVITVFLWFLKSPSENVGNHCLSLLEHCETAWIMEEQRNKYHLSLIKIWKTFNHILLLLSIKDPTVIKSGWWCPLSESWIFTGKQFLFSIVGQLLGAFYGYHLWPS